MDSQKKRCAEWHTSRGFTKWCS